ncbi:MAG: four helix bundle protein [Candidatus Peribacteria bacterium]|nr:four helix bundle protein [Candidatus Peribacteria bacterium]
MATIYNLETRTLTFARSVRLFIRKLSRTISNIEDSKQVVRSSGSIAANYIEANESLSKKDFIMRIKICRKEAKESVLWLTLLDISDQMAENERLSLIKEAQEFVLIFAAILRKSSVAPLAVTVV